MKREELRDALRYAPEHPLWGAVLWIIGAYREEAVQRAKDPTLTDKETNLALGAVTAADEIAENMDRMMRDSRKDDAE